MATFEEQMKRIAEEAKEKKDEGTKRDGEPDETGGGTEDGLAEREGEL